MKHIFYRDAQQTLVARAATQVYHHSLDAFANALSPNHSLDHAYDGRRTYVYTTNEHVVPRIDRSRFIEDSGVARDSKALHTSNRLLLTQPKTPTLVQATICGFGSLH